MVVYAAAALEPHIRASNPGAAMLTTGTMDFWATWPCLKKYGITSVSKADVRRHESCAPDEFAASSKKMCGLFFRHFGYDVYEEVDINERADVVWDLNYPVPKELEARYDLVLNVSGQYAMNAIESYFNVMRMTKVGGTVMVCTFVGDMTNRFYLNPSPDFLVDFHCANGFTLEKTVLQNRTGYVGPYDSADTKVTFAGTLIPARFFLGRYVKECIRDLRFRRHVRKRRTTPSAPANPGGPAGGGLREWLRTNLSATAYARLRRARLMALHRYVRLDNFVSPDWVVWCVFKKVEQVKAPQFEIVNTYRRGNIFPEMAGRGVRR
jgi:hypothetical protein